MDNLYWCIGYDLILPDIVDSKGSYVYDGKGKKYVDLESGVWCTPLGHSHPKVNRVMKEQSEKINHTGYCYSSPVTDRTADKVLQITDISEGKCVFLSSGSEAVEFGVQIIRKLTKRPLLLSLSDSFLGSYGSAGKKSKNEWYFFDWTPCNSCERLHNCDPQCELIKDVPFDKIGGFVFEPGSSSGFIRFPPEKLIKNLAKLIKSYEGLLQVNEITTGIGRTGEWFGYQHYGLKPDIVSMGKGLGNGYPVSSIAMSIEIFNRLRNVSFIYSQSHQNDPLGCAVAGEVISVIKKENLIDRSKKIGNYFISKLKKICKKYDIISEIRGRGLMIAIEINKNEINYPVQIFRELLDSGFIVAYGRNFLRVDPPLTIRKGDIDNFVNILDQILNNIRIE